MIALAQQSNILDEVIHGEALAVLRTLPDNSVDAIVCDPPGNLKFMGKKWDDYGSRDQFIFALRAIMAEALRVLKPGGHAFVWALPRTSHWTGIALEDAGFEIRDCVNHFYDASTLMQHFLASLTPSQSDAFKALMDSQAVPSLVSHIFGSGFPKSADISKAIDKMQGAEREVVGRDPYYCSGRKRTFGDGNKYGTAQGGDEETAWITAPATPEASQWNGWGTALKPSSEHWWLCRKPLSEPTIAANVLKWGTGAINIDASRVGTEPRNTGTKNSHAPSGVHGIYGSDPRTDRQQNYDLHKPSKRFPANLLLSHSVWCVPNGVKKVRANRIGVANPHDRPDHPTYGKYGYTGGSTSYNDSEGMEQVEDWLCDESCPIRLLDEQSGVRKSGGGDKSSNRFPTPGNAYRITHTQPYECEPSEGGASRYFQRFSPFIYQAKASRSERNRGCEGLPYKTPGECTDRKDGSAGLNNPRAGAGRTAGGFNTHPTVKSIALCRYLVRMITPPGGIVLDCFAGSGSTLVAAIHEGMHFIGIEMNDSEQEPYISIARARIEQAFREVQS